MPKPYQVGVAADTRAFTKGIEQGVLKPLEETSQALEEVGKDSLRAGNMLEDSLRDSQRATADLTADQKKLHDVIEKGSRSSFRKFEQASDRGMDDASDNMRSFKDEAKANMQEVASSFTGSMDSAVDLVQGTLGGLVTGIAGPIGLAAGAAAIGLGSIYNMSRANAEKSKRLVSEMYDDMLESGQKYLSEEYKQNQYWLILKGESELLALDKAKEYATLLGIHYTTVAAAWAGDTRSMGQVDDALAKKREDNLAKLNAATKANDAANIDLYTNQITWLDSIDRKQNARAAQIDATAVAIGREQAAWTNLQAKGNEATASQIANYGKVQDELGTIRQAVEDIPTKHNVGVKVALTFDYKSFKDSVQGALNDTQFKVYVDAYTNPNRNGGKYT